jgi:hypothetical protein
VFPQRNSAQYPLPSINWIRYIFFFLLETNPLLIFVTATVA